MKRDYFILLLLCFGFNLNAQVINFPDANLKARLLQSDVTNTIAGNIKIDGNNDGEIEVSEAQSVTYLNVSNSSISDLTGLSYFNLAVLDCSNNLLTNLGELNLSYLDQLDCSHNQLTSLIIPSVSGLLVDINCSYNFIESIDMSMLGFTDYVNISNNNISSFIPPQYIVYLDIRNNDFNGFTIPSFAMEAILIYGGNPSDQLIYNGSWRAPKELVFSSDMATTIDLSNVPTYSYEIDEGQPNFYFYNCSLLESIKLNNNLLSTQNYNGGLSINNCANLNLICGDVGEETYFIQRLSELNLDSQVQVSTECQLVNPNFESTNGIRLFPNPAEDVLNIQVQHAEISSISIFNSLGQLVLVCQSTDDTSSIDVSPLTSGTYIIKIISEKRTFNDRFVKK